MEDYVTRAEFEAFKVDVSDVIEYICQYDWTRDPIGSEAYMIRAEKHKHIADIGQRLNWGKEFLPRSVARSDTYLVSAYDEIDKFMLENKR